MTLVLLLQLNTGHLNSPRKTKSLCFMKPLKVGDFSKKYEGTSDVSFSTKWFDAGAREKTMEVHNFNFFRGDYVCIIVVYHPSLAGCLT